MNDTPEPVRKEYARRFQQLTAEERLAMATRMFDTAKALVLASLPEDERADELKRRQHLFLRFYGRDFSPEQREKILRHIARHCAEDSDS